MASPTTDPRSDTVSDGAEQAARSPWVERLGSLGFMAQGLLYLVVAGIAGSVGFVGGQASQTGAISALSEQTFGTVLLVGLAVGLAGYAALRALHVVINPSGADGWLGVGMRASYGVRALIYGGLTVYTVAELLGAGGGGGGGEDQLTRQLLELPAGSVLVAGIGVGMLALGGYQLWSAATHRFMDQLSGATPRQRRLTRIVGTAGHAARGIVFATVGVLFARAALQSDPSEAGGVDEALQTIASSPGGTVALMVVALGLAAFGLYCWAIGSWSTARHAG